MNAGELLQWTLQAPCKAAAVSILSTPDLCALRDYLEPVAVEGQASGEILGLCILEQADRFVLQARNPMAVLMPAEQGGGE